MDGWMDGWMDDIVFTFQMLEETNNIVSN